MKKGIIFLYLLFLSLLIGCESTTGWTRIFTISGVYPNPANIHDTLTIGVSIAEYQFDTEKELFVIAERKERIDTLRIIRLIEGNTPVTNPYIQAIKDHSSLIIQCDISTLHSEVWNLTVIGGKMKASQFLNVFE